MPEALAVAFGAYLDELATDPWAASEPWALGGDPDQPARIGTYGLGGRGLITFFIRDRGDGDVAHVVITQLNY